MALPPGPRGLPLLGSTLDAFAAPYSFFVDAWREHGDVVLLKFGPFKYFLLNDPDALKHVLLDNARNYKKSRTYEFFVPLLGRGLLTNDGDDWRRRRRMAQPAFHHTRLAALADVMATDTGAVLETWRDEIDVHTEMVRLTLRIVCRALFDVKGEYNARIGEALNVCLRSIDARATTVAPIPLAIPTPANLRYRRAIGVLDEIVLEMIASRRAPGSQAIVFCATERVAQLKRSDPVPSDLLSMLMSACDEEGGPALTDAELRDELMTLLLAGFETTANGLTWALYLLGRAPEQLERLRVEVDEVLGERTPTIADLPQLAFTKNVFQEALRLYPPVWKYEREALEADRIGRFDIPRGAMVGATTHVLHRHPKHWDRPDEFDPDRFVPERSASRHKFAYLPFSAGPRQCIGNAFAMMEAQIILAMIVQRFDLRVTHQVAPDVDPAVTLRLRNRLRVEVKPRQRAAAAV